MNENEFTEFTEFTLKATLKQGTSQKGNEYTYLDLAFDKDYHKRVFLDQAEIILLKKSVKETPKFPDLK